MLGTRKVREAIEKARAEINSPDATYLAPKACWAALPMTDMWHSCLHGQRRQLLMVIDVREMSRLHPPLHFLPTAPAFIFIRQ